MGAVSLLILCFGSILCGSVAIANLITYQPERDLEPLTKITINRNEVFVSTGLSSTIYKLSANLSVLQIRHEVVLDQNSEIRGLSLTNGGQYLVVCHNMGCNGYNASDLHGNYLWQSPPEAVLHENNSVAVFPGENIGDVYTGSAMIMLRDHYRMSLGQYMLNSDSTLNEDLVRLSLYTASEPHNRIFHTGFVSTKFAYYIVEDGLDIRILRVCTRSAVNPSFTALYEVKLMCNGASVFSGASLLEDFPNTTNNTLLLTVRPPADTSGTSRVCAYNISDINTAMDNGLTACAAGEDRATVWADRFSGDFADSCSLPATSVCNLPPEIQAIRGDNLASIPLINETRDASEHFTSSVIIQLENEVLIFFGDKNGSLLKYVFWSQNLSNPVRYNTTTITDTSITSLQWSLGSDYVYGLTSRQVIAIPVEDCGSFRECTSCTGLGDPLCGWCSIENKCSRRSECSNNNETRRWIQDQTMCIVNITISPNTLSVQVENQQFIITADGLPPPLDDESYYCVFGDLGSSLLEGNLIPGVNFTDLTCNYSFIVEQFSNGSDDTAVVDFSLRSDLTNISFVIIDDGFRFFNCSTHTSCRSCLSSNNLCGWCLYDKKCTSSSDQCKVSTDWINTANSSSTDCPLILNYTITDGRSDRLFLETVNLLPPSDESYTYECVISSHDGVQSTILQAEYMGSDSLVCVSEAGYVNGTVSIRWIGPDVEHSLESEIDFINIVLYNCSALTRVCSSCLSMSNLLSLDCGWCHDSRNCIVTNSCSASNTFTANSSDTCPSPQITMVNPNSGPYQGGTDVTINGTDLGVVFEDIINITIGGALCIIYSDSYQPGVGFVCNTSGNSLQTNEDVFVDVSVMITREESVEIATFPKGFRYAEITVTGVNPARIPISGNISMTVTGNNLNISNSLLAEIILVDVICIIETVNSTSLQCISGNRTTPRNGVLVFSLDNARVVSNVAVVYTANPMVNNLINSNVIRSGGTYLRFIGTLLDVVEDPMMIVYVINTTSNLTVESYPACCMANHEEQLKCLFPNISATLEVLNDSYKISYGIRLAGVPDLDQLEERDGLSINVLNDPVFLKFETFKYDTENLTINGTDIPLCNKLANRPNCEDIGIQVNVGINVCTIMSISNTSILCDPPRSSTDMMPVIVSVGKNLFFHVGNAQYAGSNPANDDSNDTIIIIITILIVVLIVLFLSIAIAFFIWKSNSKSKPNKTMHFTNDTDVNMYASPAYGTHHVFSEPGLDHLYEPIDEFMDEAIHCADNNNNWVLKPTSVHNKTDDHAVLQNNEDSESSTGYVIKDLGVNDYLDLQCDKDNLLASISANPTTKQNDDNKNM